MNKKYDIAIAYRIYPKISKVPAVYPDDKFKLSELCLYSLKQSLTGVKAKIFVLLDNCPKDYSELFKKYFDEDDLELIELGGVGNAETFKLQMEILSKQNDAELIYFAEDDYFYLENRFKEMIDFFNNKKNVHFITPYYHLDYKTMDLQKEFISNSVNFKGKEWLTVASTTMTFLTSKEILNKLYNVFLTYTKNNYDNSMWLSLTKHKVKNPFLIFKYLFTDNHSLKIFLKAYIYCKKQIFFGQKWKLWVPRETIATHMDNKHLAPNINWAKKFYKSIGKINFLS